ncbi:U11/U12 small nuclear ribonucleoprotein 35 kDa protein-like protein, partial [Dinothrombium tinctorium]
SEKRTKRMMKTQHTEEFNRYVQKIYDPLKVGSIDGSDKRPHDKAIVRAIDAEYKPNARVIGEPLNTVFVAHLHTETTEDTIRRLFSKYGEIKRLRLIRDLVTGHSKRYAFVEFCERRDAMKAVDRTHNTILDGRKIFVDFECERILQGWKPRRLGGGFGGNKNSGQLRFGCKNRPFKRPIIIQSYHESKERLRSQSSRSHHLK